MKIRPLNDKLIVERQEVENKSEGGIVLTSQSVK
ncbi:co-chaperone GroES, partial [Vibrio parahaemolyticus]